MLSPVLHGFLTNKPKRYFLLLEQSYALSLEKLGQDERRSSWGGADCLSCSYRWETHTGSQLYRTTAPKCHPLNELLWRAQRTVAWMQTPPCGAVWGPGSSRQLQMSGQGLEMLRSVFFFPALPPCHLSPFLPSFLPFISLFFQCKSLHPFQGGLISHTALKGTLSVQEWSIRNSSGPVHLNTLWAQLREFCSAIWTRPMRLGKLYCFLLFSSFDRATC